ncbi:MAG: AAC(3) family N-acetyltransferase [Gemmatimonadetes bacterium]|nr:AAC(3) family N-acetyltransferase [Gemmatimonadota bacterium]
MPRRGGTAMTGPDHSGSGTDRPGPAPLRRDQIEAGLQALGLAEGDNVLLHSSLSSLGDVAGGANTVVDAFLSVLGTKGTLVVPTFGDLGVITRVVASRPEAVLSIHPKASVAAIGAEAEHICHDHWKAATAHGADTPYMRLADLGGHVCLLGVDQDRNTTLHSVEALLELPYLETVEATGFSTPEGEVTRSWRHFPGPHRDFIGLDRRLREAGLVRLGQIGNAAVRLMKSSRVIDHLLEVGRADPAFALCDNPLCADCVKQRTAIRKHARRDASSTLVSRDESFTLTSAASLGGSTLDTIVSACEEANLKAIEFDGLNGKDIVELGPSAVEQAVTSLRDRRCEVVALRCNADSFSPDALLSMARACSVHRLVVPICRQVEALASMAAEAHVDVSAYNTTQRGQQVQEQFTEWRTMGLHLGLCLRPAAFARLGEKPFLESYGARLKRFVDQLDVEDGTFDGQPALLARGNAEIKELVSILRCSNFASSLTLSASNRQLTDLPQTMSSFLDLLDSL